MKWKIKFILLLLLFVCGTVNASGSFSDYNGSISKANKYILDFDRYKLFIDSSDKYLYDGDSLSSSSSFKNGGFINTYEFKSTMIKNDSYLSTGARYFTMTENGNNVDVVNVRMIGSYNKYDSFESRVTEFIIPKAEITGSGTRTDPWVFVNIKYNVTVNLVGATINGSSSKTSLGTGDIGNLKDVGGTFNDLTSLNGQSSVSSFLSGLSSADGTGQGWFSEATRASLDAVSTPVTTTNLVHKTWRGEKSIIASVSEDSVNSVSSPAYAADLDPYNMSGFEDNYNWLWGDAS